MDILFSRLFWGVFIIVIGLSFVLTALLNIKLPVVRILIAMFIIYIGVNMLIGSFRSKSVRGFEKDNTFFFQSRNLSPDMDSLSEEYSVVFGSQNLDLSHITISQDRTLKINSIFGSSMVYIPENINIRVKANAAFGAVQMPNSGSVIIGEDFYSYRGDSNSDHTLFIEGNAVFGSFKLLVKNP